MAVSDERIIAKHRSGMKITLAPSLAGNLKLWGDLSMASVVPLCTYRGRAKFAAWLRKAAKAVERAK